MMLHFHRHSMSSNLSSHTEAKRLKFQDVFILWTRFKEFEIIPRIINGDKAFVVCVLLYQTASFLPAAYCSTTMGTSQVPHHPK